MRDIRGGALAVVTSDHSATQREREEAPVSFLQLQQIHRPFSHIALYVNTIVITISVQ